MSAYVKIGRKTARAILDALEHRRQLHGETLAERNAAQLLREALAPSSKATRARTATRQEKKARKATKAEETAEIRTAVLWRDGDRCVICDRTAEQAGQPLQMDHFWPKGRTPQSVETCWTLCAYDHSSKTRNSPSAAWWLEKFAIHARQHHYHRQERRARDRIAAMAAISAAGEVMAGVAK